MTDENIKLKEQAEHAKKAYWGLTMDKATATAMIMPYLDAYNAFSKINAKKYGQRYFELTPAKYLRSHIV